ncbi:protein FAM83A [Nothobranchius furzeri]|uniref:Family with sequence similarity 83 member E n=1 Tax=Nothobranchius furzeri TaxID=105023 RepID=A0A8C6P6Z5_NOTFU|nr:protein FAM83D [Nothobranchius furzeri]KAF7207985.1 protein FAM83D-like [Nothobranchius furzeri]
MSNSREQSLDENVVFLPVDESNPEFLHSEREREAVERLLSEGPEAFYGSIGSELSRCFLSPEEVNQINSWAQKYQFNQVEEQNGEENSCESEDFYSTYSPCNSDKPIPDLDLGWPNRSPWMLGNGSVAIHTSPSMEGTPPVREVIRWHLQNAQKVIAIVADKLTDNVIISDLHARASRGVPVYIILNQRSLQENFTLNKLRHPNMRVRLLRGKTFCSRTGRMVVGEMRSNFLLLDLETVIHGSYNLTWMDAHLHRQLITVLRGPVVDQFDQEFRVLFAASVPAPDLWRVSGADMTAKSPHQTTDFSDFRYQRSEQPEITNPPSPPADAFLDWEAMGVIHKDSRIHDSPLDLSKEHNKSEGTMDRDVYTSHLTGEKMRINENASAEKPRLSDNSVTFSAASSSSNISATERILRLERKVEKQIFCELAAEHGTNLHESIRTKADKAEPVYPPAGRKQLLSSVNEVTTEENKPASRKPLILKVPGSEDFSSVSDIMRRMKLGTTDLLRRGKGSTMSERTQSMMDLMDPSSGLGYKGQQERSVPRFQGNLDPDHMTPALALMTKRNNESLSYLNRPPKLFPHLRPQNSTNDHINRRWSLAEVKEYK